MKQCMVGFLLVVTFSLTACHRRVEGPLQIRVGTISGPETQLMQRAAQVARRRYHLQVQVVSFSDFSLPNQALQEGDIDVNAFQHRPFLRAQSRIHHYHFVVVGKTFLYPMGLYSQHYKKISQLPLGAKVAIPNDPSNEARALLLLQQAHLLRLKANSGDQADIADIVSNPKQIKIIALDAAQVPRVLPDVALAAINTNYAAPAGLSPKRDALVVESVHSPYMNVIVVRANEAKSQKVKDLVQAFQSRPVRQLAKTLFGDNAVAGWSAKSSRVERE